MDKFQVGLCLQLLYSKTQSLFPSWVQILKEPVKASNAKHVQRQVDKSITRFQSRIEGGHKRAHSQTDQDKHQAEKPYAPFYCPNSSMQVGQRLFHQHAPTVLTHRFVSHK